MPTDMEHFASFGMVLIYPLPPRRYAGAAVLLCGQYHRRFCRQSCHGFVNNGSPRSGALAACNATGICGQVCKYIESNSKLVETVQCWLQFRSSVDGPHAGHVQLCAGGTVVDPRLPAACGATATPPVSGSAISQYPLGAALEKHVPRSPQGGRRLRRCSGRAAQVTSAEPPAAPQSPGRPPAPGPRASPGAAAALPAPPAAAFQRKMFSEITKLRKVLGVRPLMRVARCTCCASGAASCSTNKSSPVWITAATLSSSEGWRVDSIGTTRDASSLCCLDAAHYQLMHPASIRRVVLPHRSCRNAGCDRTCTAMACSCASCCSACFCCACRRFRRLHTVLT